MRYAVKIYDGYVVIGFVNFNTLEEAKNFVRVRERVNINSYKIYKIELVEVGE